MNIGVHVSFLISIFICFVYILSNRIAGSYVESEVKVKVTQLCPTLCDPMDYTVHGILQARILEWVAFPFSIEKAFPTQGLDSGLPHCRQILAFPGGSDGKQFACNTGDQGSVPGSGRSPGEGNGNLLQYSGLENSMDRGAWQAIVHEVTKLDTTEWLTHTHTHTHTQ